MRVRHFSCEFPHKMALVTCPMCVSIAQARTKCRPPEYGSGILPVNFHTKCTLFGVSCRDNFQFFVSAGTDKSEPCGGVWPKWPCLPSRRGKLRPGKMWRDFMVFKFPFYHELRGCLSLNLFLLQKLPSVGYVSSLLLPAKRQMHSAWTSHGRDLSNAGLESGEPSHPGSSLPRVLYQAKSRCQLGSSCGSRRRACCLNTQVTEEVGKCSFC